MSSRKPTRHSHLGTRVVFREGATPRRRRHRSIYARCGSVCGLARLALVFALAATPTALSCTFFTDIDEIEPASVPCEVRDDGTTVCGDPAFTICSVRSDGSPSCRERAFCDDPPEGLCPDFDNWTCVEQEAAFPLCADVDDCASASCGSGETCIDLLGMPAECRPTLYVSTDGDDGNDGSSGSPLATIDAAVALIPDDQPTIILLREGVYQQTATVLNKTGIVIMGQGDVALTHPTDGGDQLLSVEGTMGIIIRDLTLSGGPRNTIRIRDSVDVVLQSLTVRTDGETGTGGQTEGVQLQSVMGVDIYDVSISGPGASRNHHLLHVINGEDVEMRYVTIEGAEPTEHDGRLQGIRVDNTDGCVIRDTTIRNILATRNNAYGLRLGTTSDAVIERVDIDNVRGDTPESGTGGPSVGIRIEGDTIIRNVRINGIFGGDAVETGSGGTAAGLEIADGDIDGFADVSNISISNVASGAQPDGDVTRPSSCVTIESRTGGVALAHMTCANVQTGQNSAAVVSRDTDVTIERSIFFNITSFCIDHNDGFLIIENNLFSSCTAPVDSRGQVPSRAPEFRDLSAGDVHLVPGSVGIDDGPADAPGLLLEPAPNGCALNLGAFGGSLEAVSNPGGVDCR